MLGIRNPGSDSSLRPRLARTAVAGLCVGDVAIADKLVWERTHVARALHVVLTSQRVDAYTFTPNVTGDHGQIGDADDCCEPWLCSVTPKP
jgi:hypothetical protein